MQRSLSDLSALMSATLPTHEELDARESARRAEHDVFLRSNPNAFVGVSLKAWLEMATGARIPIVPATEIASIPRKTILRFDETFDHERAVWDGFAHALKALPSGHMARWDTCAGLDLKSQMASANGAEEPSDTDAASPRRSLHPDDPRAFEILYAYPLDVVPVWGRPWIQAKAVEGFPVEFRVFVQDSLVLGIASYYPQRALPDTEEIAGYVEQCMERAQALIDHISTTKRYPWMPGYDRFLNMCDGKIHATLDFLIDTEGQALFLEAGPPFGAGAHPCAFMGQEKPKGIALALAPGVTLR